MRYARVACAGGSPSSFSVGAAKPSYPARRDLCASRRESARSTPGRSSKIARSLAALKTPAGARTQWPRPRRSVSTMAALAMTADRRPMTSDLGPMTAAPKTWGASPWTPAWRWGRVPTTSPAAAAHRTRRTPVHHGAAAETRARRARASATTCRSVSRFARWMRTAGGCWLVILLQDKLRACVATASAWSARRATTKTAALTLLVGAQ